MTNRTTVSHKRMIPGTTVNVCVTTSNITVTSHFALLSFCCFVGFTSFVDFLTFARSLNCDGCVAPVQSFGIYFYRYR